MSEAERERENLNGFLQFARETGDKVLQMHYPLVVHHYDCDGLSSGSIVAFALKEKGIPFKTHVVKKLDGKIIGEIAEQCEKEGLREIVFTDIGSGQIQLVNSLAAENIVVMDHHPAPEKPNENIRLCNAHDFGFDGSTEICSASTAFFCFRHLEKKEILQMGIVGSVGDLQDYAKTGFIGLNRRMLEEGIEKEFVFVSKDLKFFGRVSRPLIWFLTYSTEPFLPGLSGNEKACALFLKGLELPLKSAGGEWLCYNDLNVFQRKKLISALVECGKQKKIPEDVLEELVGDAYLFLQEPEKSELRDATEFSTLLNACGRHNQAALGVCVCLWGGGALDKARSLLTEHRKMIRFGLTFAQKNTMDVGAFYFLDARGEIPDTVIGIVAGAFFNSGLVERSKPIIAFSFDEENKTKISSRGSKGLIEAGLDLNEVMRKAGEAAGGLGGGHKIASGATIPTARDAENAFLKKAKEVIKVQLQLNSGVL